MGRLRILVALAMLSCCCRAIAQETAEQTESDEVRQAISRTIPLLEKASAGSADERTCFTCHSQAMPVLALAEARRHGFEIDQDNFQRQIDHTRRHLKRGEKAYLNGKGQGGGVDTAGYALWALEDGDREPDEVTQPVVDWLLQRQHDKGYWKCSSNRPPSEASNFTSTYLAVRALDRFAKDQQAQDVAAAKEQTSKWLAEAEPKDVEDHVFRLLSFDYVDTPAQQTSAATEQLKGWQRTDGGWSQKEDLESDAYATATVMYALHRVGVSRDDDSWRRGVRFLLDAQQEDGSCQHLAERPHWLRLCLPLPDPCGNTIFSPPARRCSNLQPEELLAVMHSVSPLSWPDSSVF